MICVHARYLSSFWGYFPVTLGSCWDHVGIIVGSFGDHFGGSMGSLWSHSGSLWDHFGIVLWSVWDRIWIVFGVTLRSLWDRLGVIAGSCWGHVWDILASFWDHACILCMHNMHSRCELLSHICCHCPGSDAMSPRRVWGRIPCLAGTGLGSVCAKYRSDRLSSGTI